MRDEGKKMGEGTELKVLQRRECWESNVGKLHVFSILTIPVCNNITTLAAGCSETEYSIGTQISQCVGSV